MYAIDFKYDSQYLSDFGFIICNFNYSNGANEADIGSKIKFYTVPIDKGKKNCLTGTQYEDCIECSFDICKDPDLFQDDKYIENEELRKIIRWLNRNEFLDFTIIDIDGNEDVCHYMCSFNIQKICLYEKICGLRLKMITNSPFGLGQKQVSKWFVRNIDSALHPIINVSDEIGIIYPTVKLSCKFNGDFIITNTCFSDKPTIIKNCVNGEEITLRGDTKTIESSNKNHLIYNDFNFEFPKLMNTYDNNINFFNVSQPCDIQVEYYPLIKGVI